MSTEITINQDIVEINVTEEVVTIEAPSGAYPLPSLVNSVFGRVGNVVAQEGDYTLTQIGDVTLTSPSNGQVLKYNGTAWVNSSDTDTGLTSVGLSMPSAFSVANSPLTANGTLSVTGAGTTAQYVRGDGSLATLPSLTGFVPYTGATANVDLGTFDLTADVITGATGSFASNGGSNTFGINHSSGSGIALNITKGGNGEGLYINKTSGSGNAATIIGTLNATTLVKSGGTSSQYLMADGSVSTLTNPVTGTGTTNTLPKFTGASTIGNSNITDSGTLITLGSNTQISSGALGIGTFPSVGYSLLVGKNITGTTTSFGVYQFGTVQSDVTTTANGFYNQVNTQAASFSLNYNHFLAVQGTIGAGSTITTQTAFNVASNLIGGTNNYGFRGQIPSGTNRWNLYMDGTANNYMAGGLGIGTTSLTAFSLNVGKNITGLTSCYGISQIGTVQSDVTFSVFGFINTAIIAASAFTLSNYNHYYAQQGTFGAGSSVTNQTGFRVDATLIGATNNYAFQGQIPVGANRWNLYMSGMAANFLAGDTAIGTASLGTATQLTVGGTETAVSAISRGQLINTTLVASANGDALVGLDIAPTFTAGAFTGVTNYALRVANSLFINGSPAILTMGTNNLSNSSIVANGPIDISAQGVSVFNATTLGTRVFSRGTATANGVSLGLASTDYLRVVPTTGNVLIQAGGTFTDAGFRLDVNGTTRFIGTASSDTAPLGSELAAVTGTGTNWTLAGTNLNVGGYTHTTGSVVPLTTALAAVNGTYYQIAYTITGRTAGTITIAYGGTTTTVSETGTSGPLASSTAVLTITPTTDFDGTVVLSIKIIGTNSPSSTFASSALVIATEIRASDIATNLFFGRNNGRRNTTGSQETFIGSQAGINNTTGNLNTFLGASVGQNNTTGNFNTFIGAGSGQANVSGGDNTFVGTSSGLLNTGSLNTFLGTNTGRDNTTGQNNTFLGRSAGQANTTGNSNVMIGQAAGRFITGGVTANTISNNSIYIGAETRAAADSQSNQIVIGHNATGLGTNTTVIGNSVTTITGLYGNIRLVSGMGTAPASSTAAGTTGDIVVTAGFIYVCTATNTWVRTILTTF